MEQLAPDVHRIPLGRRDGANAYLVGDVVIDAGTKSQARRLLKAVDGLAVRALALTHAQPANAGGAGYVQDELEVPIWVGRGDVPALEDGDPVLGDTPFMRLFGGFAGSFDGRQADRELAEGDELAAGFVALETPGHSPGHLSFWRASDRVLLCGDVLVGGGGLGRRPGLHAPPRGSTPDPRENLASLRRLAALRPAVIGFGVGPPLGDAADVLHKHLNK